MVLFIFKSKCNVYFNKISWYFLAQNSGAINLIEKNLHKVSWATLSRNPAIFTYDYNKMKEDKKEINEEIIKMAMHPKRIEYYLNMGYNIEDLY